MTVENLCSGHFGLVVTLTHCLNHIDSLRPWLKISSIARYRKILVIIEKHKVRICQECRGVAPQTVIVRKDFMTKIALMFALFESNSRKWRGEVKSRKKDKCLIRVISFLRPSALGSLLPAILLCWGVLSSPFSWRWGLSVERKGCRRLCSSLDVLIRFRSIVFHKVCNIWRGYRWRGYRWPKEIIVGPHVAINVILRLNSCVLVWLYDDEVDTTQEPRHLWDKDHRWSCFVTVTWWGFKPKSPSLCRLASYV